MTSLQSEFTRFNDVIRLGWDDEQAILRERRDAVIDQIRRRIDAPGFDVFNQGSYVLRTGVKPVDGDFDIDVGLRFHTTRETWDPVELKRRVCAALSGYNVEIRRPCVTVQYQRRSEPLYHVDLNVYVPAPGGDTMLYLAVGKHGDAASLKEWRYTDPLALGVAIEQKFTPDDREQFRRVVRYLKRWKDLSFPHEGTAAPTGIALTASALQWFAPTMQRDAIANRTHYRDLHALADLVARMTAHARPRLAVHLPVPPHDDLFRRMNDEQMQVFRDKLGRLADALRTALADADDSSTSDTLRRLLGDDFPAAKHTSPRAIVSSGAAG
jgi:hypothetical protein